jgi:hypothetical protein
VIGWLRSTARVNRRLEQTDPGCPGSALDETWSRRTLVVWTTHLGGWHKPTAAGTARSAAEAGRCGGARQRLALRL